MVTAASLVLQLTHSAKSRYSTARSKPRALLREITKECAVELRKSVETDRHTRRHAGCLVRIAHCVVTS